MGCVSTNLEKFTNGSHYSNELNLFYNNIRERKFLDEFNNELMKLSKSKMNKNKIDGRISVLVNYTNKKTDTLCLGENFCTHLNGLLMNDSSELLKILKKEIRYELAFSDPFKEYR